MFGQKIIFLFVILADVSEGVQLYQSPRFVGLKSGRSVVLSCRNYGRLPMSDVIWMRARSPEGAPVSLQEGSAVSFGERTGSLALSGLQPEDSGVYFCSFNGTKGPGTAVQVHRPRNIEAAIRRSNMKDAVIFVQAFLLGIFLLVPYFCFKEQREKEEALYEEPDQDHTYEGLDIEQCALYEDIPAFSQQEADEPCDMESPDVE
ncbi:hypothetical protein ACEWY4_026330 [Coilia grayii]|uniref:Ig-like domain-containing protein n=1 Tax=Coilia grayii TaxID=363190 RepID=A0ABD1IXC8_9TELE